MNTIQVFAYRGKGVIEDILIDNNGQIVNIASLYSKEGMFNIRCVVEVVNDTLSYTDNLLGKKVREISIGEFQFHTHSKVSLVKEGSFNVSLTLPFESEKYFFGCKVYEDYPVNQYGVLETIPVPTNILTIYFFFSKEALKPTVELPIEKYFDGFSHLGFFLTDLPKMKKIISREYGDKELDLVDEFSNTELIDKLFKEEIIMIVWGINPYTYPIYCSDKLDLIGPLLGEELEIEGVFNIREDIEQLSIIPGHKLR